MSANTAAGGGARMRLLITNDDGYDAPGLRALIDAMTAITQLKEITVVAPQKNHSGASSSLTLAGDIRVLPQGGGHYVVCGTPTDCVHLALSGDFLPQLPQLIVSGINDGANMGDDTIYSGTVAAAIEGHLFNVPAMAFSMTRKPARHFASGAAAARQLVERFCRAQPPGAPLYNVNIPDVPPHALGGVVPTRLGRRHVAKPALRVRETAAEMTFQIGEAGGAKDALPGTDFYATANGQISLTPLMVDLTATSLHLAVAEWLER